MSSFLDEEELVRIQDYTERGGDGYVNLTREEKIDFENLLVKRQCGEELADMGLIPPLEAGRLPGE